MRPNRGSVPATESCDGLASFDRAPSMLAIMPMNPPHGSGRLPLNGSGQSVVRHQSEQQSGAMARLNKRFNSETVKNRAWLQMGSPESRRRAASRLCRFCTPSSTPCRATRTASRMARSGSDTNSRLVMNDTRSYSFVAKGSRSASPLMNCSSPCSSASASMASDGSSPVAARPWPVNQRVPATYIQHRLNLRQTAHYQPQ